MSNPFQAKLEQAQAQLAKLEAQYARFVRNAMPGTYVTGNSGVPASRRAKLDRQIERTVTMSSELVRLRAKVAWLARSVELFDQGLINAQGRSISPSKPYSETIKVRRDGPRLFIGSYPAGIVYCDRWVDENNDYKELAFLSYRTLQISWRGTVPAKLKAEIEAHAATLQARRGEEFQISTCGQTVLLGE